MIVASNGYVLKSNWWLPCSMHPILQCRSRRSNTFRHCKPSSLSNRRHTCPTVGSISPLIMITPSWKTNSSANCRHYRLSALTPDYSSPRSRGLRKAFAICRLIAKPSSTTKASFYNAVVGRFSTKSSLNESACMVQLHKASRLLFSRRDTLKTPWNKLRSKLSVVCWAFFMRYHTWLTR